MVLLLTTDEEAQADTCSSISNATRVGQQCVGQPEELRSEDQITRENASARCCEHRIGAMEGGVTNLSRPRTHNRDRGDLLAKVFASDHTHC